MSRLGPALLAGSGLLLSAALASLWVDPSTLRLRGGQWQAPAAREPDFAAMAPLLAPRVPPVASEFAATLQRPLFAPNRRPPVPLPPPALPKPQPGLVVAEKPPPDPLAEVKILGMYTGAHSGGIIARVDGKSRRAQLHDKINDWTITSISDREVTLSQAGTKRVLPLEVKRQAGAPVATQPLSAPDTRPPPGAASALAAPAPARAGAPPADPFVFGGQLSGQPATTAPAAAPAAR